MKATLAISFKEEIDGLFDIFRSVVRIERRIVRRALNDLGESLTDAENKLNRRNKKDRADFENHFGVDDDHSMDFIKTRVLREQKLVAAYLRKGAYKRKFIRTSVFGAGTFAWVREGDVDHNVHLEPEFWNAPRKGMDSKMGSIGHEISHFDDIGDTDDNGGYGVGNARLRATPANALNALRSADSFEYYIEKVRL